MRNALYLLFFLLSIPLAAQQVPKAEIFGGYSYLSVGEKDLTSRESLNGWEASISGNLTKRFAIEGDVTGHYKSVSSEGVTATISDYTFSGGPRVNFRPFFAHVLVGGDRVSASAFGFSAAHDGLALIAGGGVVWPVSQHLAARASADYVYARHNVSIPNLLDTTVTLNNVRVSAGIVYTFGGTSPSVSPSARQEPSHQQAIGIPALGAEVETSAKGGAEIVVVSPNGVAGVSGLRAGDVIQSVDGKRINSAQELAAELGAKSSGSVRLTYLRTYWQGETTITIQK